MTDCMCWQGPQIRPCIYMEEKELFVSVSVSVSVSAVEDYSLHASYSGKTVPMSTQHL